jgi:hypothetical protein
MRLLLLALVSALAGCYPKISLEGFDSEAWKSRQQDCTTGLPQAELILKQQEKLLSEGQAQIITLLGEPNEHELYTRNEKFFYYDLGALHCGESKRLSIRFDAIDRAKEIAIIYRD